MTFTVIGRCGRTGMLGIGTATRAWTVGVRVPFIKSRVGAVAVMANADERLGHTALDLLTLGYKAPGVLEEMKRVDPYYQYRQLGIIDDDGHTAAFTGEVARQWAGHRCGDNYIVLGNILTAESVIDAMEVSLQTDPEADLEERLMLAIEAGRDAGGQSGGDEESAALLVYDQKAFSRVNLRVDIHAEPVAELRRIFNLYRPAIPYYDYRQVNPNAPSLHDWLADRR